MIEELRWKKFPVLDGGFVCLVDVMGDDSSVVQAARVSYGKDERLRKTLVECRDNESLSVEDTEEKINQIYKGDCDLIRYLMRHRHTTPFEMAELKFLVRVPMDCWRQWIRHRTASVNEYSTRYTEAIDSQQKTPPDQWRLQSGNNKQGSEGFLEEWPDKTDDDYASMKGESAGEYLTRVEEIVQKKAANMYQERLRFGIAKEQARKDLPLSTYTEAYWKIDLHNLLHFLSLRMDSHAQKEIRDYATIIGQQIVKPLFPIVWEAFEDYRLNGMFLSRLDQFVIINFKKFPDYSVDDLVHLIPNKREREECIAKLQKLGFLL